MFTLNKSLMKSEMTTVYLLFCKDDPFKTSENAFIVLPDTTIKYTYKKNYKSKQELFH